MGIEGQPTPNTSVGTQVALKNAGAPYITMTSFGGMPGYSAVSNVANPYGAKLALSAAGGTDILPIDLPDLVSVPPQFSITAPMSPALVRLSEPLTVTWTPVAANVFYFWFPQGSGHVCKADGAAGTFTIPAATMQAQLGAGEPGVELAAMNVGSGTLKVNGVNRALDVRTTVTAKLALQVQP